MVDGVILQRGAHAASPVEEERENASDIAIIQSQNTMDWNVMETAMRLKDAAMTYVLVSIIIMPLNETFKGHGCSRAEVNMLKRDSILISCFNLASMTWLTDCTISRS